MHRQGAIPVVCQTYGAQVLGITPQDRCLSASKAFFAYGVGASVLFPMSVGAAAVLEPAPANPAILAERSVAYAATLFFAGPTFFAGMLRAGLPADALAGSGWPPRRARPSRPPCITGGPHISAWTSSTAWA
jgi:acyl-coenzyme A synthetase/AMP-(fatty) acid ligase